MAEEEQRDASSQPSRGKGKPIEVVVEDASEEEEECCPICNDLLWFRLIAEYKNGVFWLIYCGACGKPVDQKWNPKP